MSKNIEVLLRAKETTELLGPRNIFQESPEPRRPATRVPPVGTKEEAELVQRVFLLPACEAPRLVVFQQVGQMDEAVGICARAGQNLASQTDASVCVVDGDLHSPSLHECFGVDNLRGLADAVLESGPIQDFVPPLSATNLSVLTAAPHPRDPQPPWKSPRLPSRT